MQATDTVSPPSPSAAVRPARPASTVVVVRDGAEPAGVPRIEPAPAPPAPRDVFLYFISGAKEKAPAAAMALIRALG